jgi:LacI family transcriptional regulator
VRFPHYQLGTEAATLLLERIDAQDSPVKILFLAPELVPRGSSVPLAGPQKMGKAVPLRRPGRG